MRAGNLLVSVIVTVYNLEKYLRECLNSIFSQELLTCEVIIVDDGSMDGSKDIIREYEERYPQIVQAIFLKPPARMGRAHEVGYNAAKGKYCQFVDGDDILMPHSLEKIIYEINKTKADVIMGKCETFVEEGGMPFKDADLDYNQINGKTKEEVLSYLSFLPQFHMFFWRYAFKKNNVPQLLYYHINRKLFLNDWLPATKILVSADTFVCLEEPFYRYRQRNGESVSGKLKKEYPEACFFTFLEFLNLLFQKQWTHEKEAFIRSRIVLLFQMAFNLSDLLLEKQCLEIASELSNYNREIMSLETNNKEFLELRNSIEQNGVYDGLLAAITERKEQCILECSESRSEPIWIFPTGQKAEYIARVLQKEGFQVKGFLDNDDNKSGLFISGLPCYKPNILESMETKPYVIVATIWDKAQKEIRTQLLKLGVPHRKIKQI